MHSKKIHWTTRWFLWSKKYKAEVAAQPAATQGLRHIEWDGWGFPGAGDTVVYLVFDPNDSLLSTDSSRRFAGIPCEVPRVRRSRLPVLLPVSRGVRPFAQSFCVSLQRLTTDLHPDSSKSFLEANRDSSSDDDATSRAHPIAAIKRLVASALQTTVILEVVTHLRKLAAGK
jgi:hypothetical protein